MEALEKARQLRPFIELANQPESVLLDSDRADVPSDREVESGIPKPLGPWSTWSDEEREDYLAARYRREQDLQDERHQLIDERIWIHEYLRRLAQLPKPADSPFLPNTMEIPLSEAQQQQLVFSASGRIHVEPTFPQRAQLRQAFLQALEGIDVARIRQCPICSNVYWADRIDKPACSRRCAGALRSRRNYESVKHERGKARQLRESGKHLNDIARELGTSVKRVRHYLATPTVVVSINRKGA
jgi:hypothetical protein